MDYRAIKTLKQQVEFVLKEQPPTRNDDAVLVSSVCSRYGYDEIRKASSIERCRRWFNQRMKYLPTDEKVARRRKINIDEWRVALGYATPSGSYHPPSEEKNICECGVYMEKTISPNILQCPRVKCKKIKRV